MKLRVLVVDDSRFFRRRVTEMLSLDPQLEVIDTAENGAQAVEKASLLKPDVITMDIEMPVMDGITAVKRIMAVRSTPILMFSSLTTDGAKATLDALEAGAIDFLPKRFEDISLDREEARQLLCARVRAIGMRRLATKPVPSRAPTTANEKASGFSKPERGLVASATKRHGTYKIVLIGTSTGGPIALQQVLTKLPANFPLPLLLIQHMPATFTPTFAQRLNSLCQIKVKEAADGDIITPGAAYLAPGGRQMMLEQRGHVTVIRVVDALPGQTYKPSVDITFTSAAKIYGGQVLAVVMTGMGADGREGARLLKKSGSTIWAQNEQTCVVYGMPSAIVDAGLADQVIPLQEIAAHIVSGI